MIKKRFMRDLLTDKETAKILGKRIDRLYKDVDYFDKYDDDEWELNEGEHFELVAKKGIIKERRFYEEGVEALARYYEKDQSGILSIVIEALTHRRRRRKKMLVSRRITQELIESKGLVETRGDLFDSDNTRTAQRHSKLVARLVALQNNYEGNHLRYR